MKAFAFILLFFFVTSFSVYERVPFNTYAAKVRRELKELFSFHFIEELTFNNYIYQDGDDEYTLSSVKAKAVFFNSFMPIASVENKINLTLQFSWNAPINSTNYISPYHIIYTADIIFNNKTYQIEFELESKEFKFLKSWESYEPDQFYIPCGAAEISFIALKAKNLNKEKIFNQELLLNITNSFIAENQDNINNVLNEGISSYYKSLAFEELGQKVYVQTSSIPLENNFDLTLEEKPEYYEVSNDDIVIIFRRKGSLNGENIDGAEIPEEDINDQSFNLYGEVYQKIITDNKFNINFEQSNNPSSKYELTGEYLKKVAKVDIDDASKLKLQANMTEINFESPNPLIGLATFEVKIISTDDLKPVFAFSLKIEFAFEPTLFQTGLNFVLLAKNLAIQGINPAGDYEIIDSQTLLQWIEDTYTCALGKNEYNLFESAVDLSYYFNTNDLSLEFLQEGYLRVIKN